MKTVLITGATRGIGLETVKQLLDEGLFVYLGSRNLEKGKQIVKDLGNKGLQNVKAVEIDITKPNTISSAKNTVENDMGKLDILINNAGISGILPQNASDASIEDIKETFETNFFGTIQVTQTFLSLLKKSENPRITNITSGLSSLTMHSDPNWMFYAFKGASYGPSKTALNAYTIALAYELRELPFKVNAVDPGFTATDFNNHQGHGTLEDATSFIIKHTLTDGNAPTGKFFSNDTQDKNEVMPW